MRYSVKDIGILTAYSGLMLSRNDAVTILVLTASGAAVVLLGFVFGLSSIRKVFKRQRNPDTNHSFLPLATIFVMWIFLPAIKIAGADISSSLLNATMTAMLIGFAAASIPLMFNLDANQMQLNDSTLWVGYWTLCSGMLASGFAAIVFAFQNADTSTSQNFHIDSIRNPAVVGMVGSVFVAWYLMGQLNPKKDGEVG